MTVPERALARVELAAVEANCRRLASQLERAELCAVVKADGYGHGANWCARAALAGGATWLAVATADEAAELRRHGAASRILVMGALTSDDMRTALEADADVVVWDRTFAELLARRVAPLPPERARVHVKLDTGMGRLGTKDVALARELCELAASHEQLELAGVMTHFATADEPGDEHFPRQLAAFGEFAAEVKKKHPGAIAHAANSAATFRDPASHFDMVRCGIAVYGLDPFHEDPAERGLEPALSLESYVASVKRFAPGESAGYGRRWTAERETWVGTLPIGYGDGWRRALSNNADVLVSGRRHPLVGTVSMDNITIDLGPDTDVRPGDVAVLIGEQGGERILAEEVARRLDTINYEVTCGLSPRVIRHHER